MTENDENTDRTERLRDIFLEVSDEPTVTESQEEQPGTLQPSATVDEQLREIIQEIQIEYGFQTSLDLDDLVRVVRLFHENYSDTAIARELGAASRDRTVARARINLHLFRETDFDAPFDIEQLRDLLQDEIPTAQCAEQLAVSPSTMRSYATIIEAEQAATAADHAYQRRFDEALTRSAPEESLQVSLDDGLADAIDSSPDTGS
ncbi:response regulator receiver protein [Haladaptatus sp. NG-WS-4]